MNGILARYLTRLFVARLLAMLFGLGSLAVLMDIVANSDDIVGAGDSVAAALGRYAILRLPGVVSQILPLTVLIAMLLTMSSLARHSELTAITGSGVSQLRLIAAMLPAVVAVSALQFLLDDRVVPRATSELRAWGVGDFKSFVEKDKGKKIWFRQGDNYVSVRKIAKRRNELVGVTIFDRDAEGHVRERIEAQRATYSDGAWILEAVSRTSSDSETVTTVPRLTWPNAIEFSILKSLSYHPKELPWIELRRLAAQSGFGNRPIYLYQVWLQKKIARPLATILMIVLAVAAVQRLRPRQQGGLMLTVGISAGFVYWIFDELVLTIGEAGLLPVVVAAWAPPLTLAAAAMTVILRHEA